MNESLLIDIMSELNPELLQDEYMERDMKKGKITFLNRIFSLKKTPKQRYDNLLSNKLSEEVMNQGIKGNEEEVKELLKIDIIEEIKSEIDKIEITEKIEMSKKVENNQKYDTMDEVYFNNLGFKISIFRRKFRNLIKIMSGITAASLVVLGIVIIVVKRRKNGIKLYEKKVQIIY